MILMLGCKSKSYISDVRIIDSIRWETRDSVHIIEKRVIRDSLRIRDSVVVSVDSLGNRTTDRWHTLERYVSNDGQTEMYKAKIDSLERIKRQDSIVYQEVEVNTLSPLQKVQISLARLVLALGSIFFVVWMIRRKLKAA